MSVAKGSPFVAAAQPHRQDAQDTPVCSQRRAGSPLVRRIWVLTVTSCSTSVAAG
jgi:hypothetical protein